MILFHVRQEVSWTYHQLHAMPCGCDAHGVDSLRGQHQQTFPRYVVFQEDVRILSQVTGMSCNTTKSCCQRNPNNHVISLSFNLSFSLTLFLSSFLFLFPSPFHFSLLTLSNSFSLSFSLFLSLSLSFCEPICISL